MAEVKTRSETGPGARHLHDRTAVRQGLGHAPGSGGGRWRRIAVIPTGALSLDGRPGRGGACPAARVVEIYGPEVVRQDDARPAHRVPRPSAWAATGAFIDAEHALDPIYARKLGVNIDELLISQPDTGEQALEITETLVALQRRGRHRHRLRRRPRAARRAGRRHGRLGLPGLQARLMSQALRKLTRRHLPLGRRRGLHQPRSGKRSGSCLDRLKRRRGGAR